VAPTPTSCPIQFTDVPQGSTFYPYVRCLACRGIVSGYADGTFRPGNTTTRGQISKMVSNAAGYNEPPGSQLYQDVPVGSTFYDYINRLSMHGAITGYPCGGQGEPCVPPLNLPYFRPANNVSRGQIAKIVSNAAGFHEDPGPPLFQDLGPDSPFYAEMQRLAHRSILGGYPCGQVPEEPCVPPQNLPYVRVNNSATRGQVSKIVANAFFPDCYTPARP
jgi:S-layer homology domain